MARHQHYRDRDHRGTEALSAVVLDTDISVRYTAGMLLADVLDDMMSRLTVLYGPPSDGSFTANAAKRYNFFGVITAAAWIYYVEGTGSFTADAVLV